jgi:hypothetical protein
LKTRFSYVSQDPVKNIHKYVAIIVDPPVVYLATDADVKALPDRGRTALAEYFQHAISEAVEDAFPIVQANGPWCSDFARRLSVWTSDRRSWWIRRMKKSLDRAINIGKVGIEIELVDSEGGQQVAAAVDRQNLGEGATVGSVNFSREERFRAATQAFDGWAKRLRDFLDSAHELSKDDVARVEGPTFLTCLDLLRSNVPAISGEKMHPVARVSNRPERVCPPQQSNLQEHLRHPERRPSRAWCFPC